MMFLSRAESSYLHQHLSVVRHVTLDPEGPGVLRIHLLPCKKARRNVPFVALLNGQDIRKKKPVELAKNIGVLTQNHYVGYSFSVEEVVRLGRYAYSPGVLARRCDDDERMVELALEKTGMAAQRRQSVLTLSGGELQRTFLAQVFAQDPKYLLLDEPTNHLDLIYQRQVFALIKEWLAQGNRAVISVVHDLSLAKKYGTRALLLDHGCMAAIGDTNTALNRDTLEKVYGMDVYAYMKEMLSQWQ